MRNLSNDKKSRSFSAQNYQGMNDLIAVADALSETTDLSEIQSIVVGAARKIARCDGSTIILRDNDKCFYVDEDSISPLWKGKRFPMDDCISGWAIKHHSVVAIKDITLDDRIPQDAYRPTYVKSLLMVPICKSDPVGAIGNYWATSYEPSTEEVELLQTLASFTSMALRNILLCNVLEDKVQQRTEELIAAQKAIEDMAVHDDLTGLYNRRGFNMLANQMLHSAARKHCKCIVAFIDLDGLKQVNDQYGHAAGDNLIIAASEILKSSLRHSDILARIGGDEFCVMAIEPEEDGHVIKNRIVNQLSQFNEISNLPYKLKASIGIVSKKVDPSTKLDVLIEEADLRMYEHKRDN